MSWYMMNMVLVIWLFTVVSIMAEEYSGVPTASEMDQNVEMGRQCVRGVNERCLAVGSQVEAFTNDSCWQIDSSNMWQAASKIKSLVPRFANLEGDPEEATEINAHTVTGLFTTLDIGNHINLFTGVPEIGTNPLTYSDSPWRIYEKNLEERYKVLNACKMTYHESVYSNTAYWYGSGTGLTWGGAYDAACADWKQVTPIPSAAFEQSCQLTWYSNYYPNYQGGESHYGEIPSGYEGYGYEANVSLAGGSAVPTGITVSVAYSYLEPSAATTNILVVDAHPSSVPNLGGIYYQHDYGGGTSYWQSSGGYSIFREELWHYWLIDQTIDWGMSPVNADAQGGNGSDPLGWYIWPAESPNPNRYYIEWHVDYSTNTPGPNCSGVFFEDGTSGGYVKFTSTNGYSMIYSAGKYVIDAGGGKYWYVDGTNPEGLYESVGFYSKASAAVFQDGHPASPDCSGTYDGGESETGPFVSGEWTITSVESGGTITNSGNTASWTGAALEGGYNPAAGSGAYGTATVSVVRKQGWWTEPDVPGSVQTWGTSTVFYTCEMKKFKCEYAIAPATNLLHSFDAFFVYPAKVGNKFENQQIDWLMETNWCGVSVGGTSQTNSPEKYVFGDPLDEYPVAVDDPTGGTVLSNGLKNVTKSGFSVLTTGKGVFGWQFNYCTNKFW